MKTYTPTREDILEKAKLINHFPESFSLQQQFKANLMVAKIEDVQLNQLPKLFEMMEPVTSVTLREPTIPFIDTQRLLEEINNTENWLQQDEE